jgi:hypothetical protein
MSIPPPTPPSRSLQILKTILYILAGLVLAAGLIAGISLMAGANSMVANALVPLQVLGGGAISNMIGPMLSAFLINLGVVTIVITLIISALLYAVGRLIGHTASLEARLARLEGRL